MGYSGGVFSTFYKRPGSVLEVREGAGRGGVREGGSALLSSFVCQKPHTSASPLVGLTRGAAPALAGAVVGAGRGVQDGCVHSAICAFLFTAHFPGRQVFCGEVVAPMSGESGEGSVAASC